MTPRTAHSGGISPRTLAWEDRTAWPLFVLSLAFFAAWVWVLADLGPATPWRTAMWTTIAATWIVFAADFVVRWVLSGDTRAFFRTRWFEAVSLAVVYLRPFVIIAYVWRLPWFRVTPARQRARLVILVTMFTFLFVFTASTLVWLAERGDPRASIVDLGDAIWWGFSTIATVGYGDFVPVTLAGRTIAVGLMMGGLVVLGVTSATVISALNDQIQRTARVRESERAGMPASHESPRPPMSG
ncbi:potassium channel family protein [Microbacterium sp. PA5]|uniref:potassium channel family protein n=1 Tax=Microbacterium sp. PA5 TaxID=3416654 RepID=UPI003CF9DD48